MTSVGKSLANPDLWPCGLVILDEFGVVTYANRTFRDWLLDDDTDIPSGQKFIELLTRPGMMYFETHLRPILNLKGEFSEVSVELLGANGERVPVYMSAIQTVTDSGLAQAYITIHRSERRKSFERELMNKRRESDEFRTLVEYSPNAIVSVGPDTVIKAWNPAATHLFGYSAHEAIGRNFDDIIAPHSGEATTSDDVALMKDGHAIRAETILQHKNGSELQLSKSLAVLRDDIGRYSGFVVIYADIRSRKAAEARVQTLLQEINHRCKNLLSVVQVIARQSARGFEDTGFVQSFIKRLASLSANQDLLIKSPSDRTAFSDLVTTQFSHLDGYAGEQVRISGPEFEVNPVASQALAMAIFELVTNSAKYGALSTQTGVIDFTWEIIGDTDLRFQLKWRESQGPVVVEPVRKGFGSQVTGPILETTTGGTTSRSYDPSGFRWSFDVSLDAII